MFSDMCSEGDDRPCSRCVKRGCSAQCKDGVRKKAKYLEDTPAEALLHDGISRNRPTIPGHGMAQQSLPNLSNSSHLFAGQSSGSASYPIFTSAGQMNMPPSSINQPHQTYVMTPQSLSAHSQNPMNQSSYHIGTSAGGNTSQSLPMATAAIANPSLDDLFPGSFDIENFDFTDFDNRYGAAEFGMLNQMSVGMANSPPSDGTGTFNPGGGNYTPGTISTAYGQSPSEDHPFPYQAHSGFGSWSNEHASEFNHPSSNFRFKGHNNNKDHLEGIARHEVPPSFAIGNSTLPSPSSMSSPQGMALAGIDDSPTNRGPLTNLTPSHQAHIRQDHLQSHQRQGHSAVSASAVSTPSLKVQTPHFKRHRDPSTVYEDVKSPYSYTAAFHSLTALIQRRFSPHKTAHIAKALAAIRPSFISCTMRLGRNDLIFMEKCLQRTLFEYEEFISATGTPTIICRRTGEVVAVGKEFSILTGWSANVLLGREPNLNVNRGGGEEENSSNPPGTGSSSLGGTNTPRNTNDVRNDAPVNIVDLLDDDSVCDFFDDYAHLAFGDSRGSVTTPCKLLRYQTTSDTGLSGNLEDQVGSRLKRRPDGSFIPERPRSKGEAISSQFGKVNAKLDCMLCWSVKRDVFDIPMLCVLNVSLALSRSITPSTCTRVPRLMGRGSDRVQI